MIYRFVFLIVILTTTSSSFAQEEAGFILTVGNESCELRNGSAIFSDALPEVTEEPEITPEPMPYRTLTLGEECDTVIRRLIVPNNDTLWLSLTSDQTNDFLPLTAVDDDNYPPMLDRRGRYFGCHIEEQGQQICRVMTELDDMSYEIQIPIVVGDAYIAPTPTAIPTSVPTPVVVPDANPSNQSQTPADDESNTSNEDKKNKSDGTDNQVTGGDQGGDQGGNNGGGGEEGGDQGNNNGGGGEGGGGNGEDNNYGGGSEGGNVDE